MQRSILTTVMLVAIAGNYPNASAQTKSKNAAAAQEDPRDTLVRANYIVDGLIKQVAPSVVQIIVTSFGALEGTPGRTSGAVGQRHAIGSGFVIDHDGYILTNAHVVNGAQRIQVVIPPRDADGSLTSALSGKVSTFPAHIVGQTREMDVALLKVDGAKAAALPLAAYRRLRQGETVFAFGSPQGLRNTITHGMISAVARQIDPDSPLIYIQTDAPVNPGKLWWAACECRGRSGRYEHVYRVSIRGKRGTRIRDPLRHVEDCLSTIERVRASAAAGYRHSNPSHHAGTGSSTQIIEGRWRRHFGFGARGPSRDRGPQDRRCHGFC